MSEFRKRPVVIDAIQLGRSPQSLHDVLEFIGSSKPYVVQDEANDTHAIVIPTLAEGSLRVSVGDWVIRDEHGAVHPCKPDIFAATYEAVNE